MPHADDPRKLDPNTFYSKHDLFLRLGIAHDTIDRARANGRLKTVDLSGRDFLFKGANVLAWLDAGAPTDPEGKTPAASRRSQATTFRADPGRQLRSPASTTTNSRSASRSLATTPTQQRTRTPMNSDHQTIDQWNVAVRLEMAAGKTKAQAVRAVVRGNPQLHRAYLIACNRGRPAAVRALQDT